MADSVINLKPTRRSSPPKLLHFSDGVLEECSSDEEPPAALPAPVVVDPSTLPWSSFLLHWALQLGTQALAVCDYLGEHLANWFGITAPKYRYEIEHGRDDDDETEEPGWQRSETVQVTARQPAQLSGPRD